MGQQVTMVVGVTGRMDYERLDSERQLEIRRKVVQVLDFVVQLNAEDWFAKDDRDFDGSDYSRWPRNGLGIPRSQVRLLTSLAPGADTMVADVAEQMRIPVWAPLPFPKELYLQATTFRHYDAGQREQVWRRLQRMEDRAFFVPLHSDYELSDSELDERLDQDLKIESQLDLRYRAAGEYVSGHCQILFALTNDQFPGDPHAAAAGDPPFTIPVLEIEDLKHSDPGSSIAGSSSILRVNRQGTTRGLLNAKTILTWAETGPTFHIYTPSPDAHKNQPGDARAGQLTVLQPFDCRPGSCKPEEVAEAWRERGVALTTAVAKRTSQFFQASIAIDESEEKRQVFNLLGLSTPADGADEEIPLGVERPFFEGLDQIARLHLRAERLRSRLQNWTRVLTIMLCVLTVLAVFLVNVASFWRVQTVGGGGAVPAAVNQPFAAAPNDAAVAETTVAGVTPAVYQRIQTTRTSLVAVAVVLLIFGYVGFMIYKLAGSDRWTFDYRGLAEGLRVQFYWSLAGLPHSVSANYMDRQRSELDWIRDVIRSSSSPYSKWWLDFNRMDQATRHRLLRVTVDQWVEGQRKFFEQGVQRKGEMRMYWRRFSFCFAAAGAWHVLLQGIWLGQPQWFERFSWVHFAAIVSAIVLLLVFLAVSRWLAVRNAISDLIDFIVKRVHRLFTGTEDYSATNLEWGLYISSAGWGAVLTLISLSVCLMLSGVPNWCPDPSDAWSVLLGTFLVIAAIGIVWSQNQQYAELERQYRMMEGLFLASRRRLHDRLNQAEASIGAADFERHIRVVHNLLYELGRQALDENAEWLLLHRSRPLDPIVAS